MDDLVVELLDDVVDLIFVEVDDLVVEHLIDKKEDVIFHALAILGLVDIETIGMGAIGGTGSLLEKEDDESFDHVLVDEVIIEVIIEHLDDVIAEGADEVDEVIKLADDILADVVLFELVDDDLFDVDGVIFDEVIFDEVIFELLADVVVNGIDEAFVDVVLFLFELVDDDVFDGDDVTNVVELV